MQKAKVNGMDESSKAPATATDLATMPTLNIQVRNIELDMEEIKNWIAPQGATAKEIYTYGRICQTLGLNPFKKEIHFIKYGNVDASIVVGYTVYIDRGEKSGKLDGWHVEMDDDSNPTQATITIHRKDWSEPFRWTVYRVEVEKLKKDGTPQSTWASQPRFQLMKCAIGQGFRLAFPSECGGLPYTAEEIAPNNGYLPDVPEVSAATVDSASSLGPNDDVEHLHNQYHKRARQLWNNNDELRHGWQEQAIGIASTNDWEVVHYQKAITLLDDEISRQTTDDSQQEDESSATQNGNGEMTYKSLRNAMSDKWEEDPEVVGKFLLEKHGNEAKALLAMKKAREDKAQLAAMKKGYDEWVSALSGGENVPEQPDEPVPDDDMGPTEELQGVVVELAKRMNLKSIRLMEYTGTYKSPEIATSIIREALTKPDAYQQVLAGFRVWEKKHPEGGEQLEM